MIKPPLNSSYDVNQPTQKISVKREAIPNEPGDLSYKRRSSAELELQDLTTNLYNAI